MAQIKPEGIVQSDPQVKLIEAIVKQAYLDIFQYIQSGKDSQSVKTKIKGLEKIVAEYDLDLQAWADVSIPGLYKEGMDNAIKQAIKDNIVYTFEDKFADFHQQTIQLIVQNAYKYTQKIADGLEEAGTSAITAEQAEKVAIQVARGEIAGSDLKTIAKNVENELRASSLSAITYKNGRNVSVDGYARTLARSILTEAQVTGIQNTHIEEGYDLVQVSDHFGECDICRPWENEVLSLTGRTKGYTTLDKAKNAGLFHSNCRHSISPYFEGLASVSQVYDTKTKTYQPKELVEAQNWVKEKGIRDSTDTVTQEAKKYISSSEKEALKLIKAGTTPAQFGDLDIPPGEIIKANQRYTGLSLLADYDNAELAQDYTLANRIAGVIVESKDQKIMPYKNTFLQRYDANLAKRNQPKIQEKDVKDILKAYEQFTTKIGIQQYNNINDAIKTGDKAKLRRIIAKEKNEEIKTSLQRMLKYI